MADSDDFEEAESEAVEPRPVQDGDRTPLQFNIRHIVVLTALFGLAFGIYRVAKDLSADEIQLLLGFGVMVGTVLFVPVAIYWLFRSN